MKITTDYAYHIEAIPKGKKTIIELSNAHSSISIHKFIIADPKVKTKDIILDILQHNRSFSFNFEKDEEIIERNKFFLANLINEREYFQPIFEMVVKPLCLPLQHTKHYVFHPDTFVDRIKITNDLPFDGVNIVFEKSGKVKFHH